MNDIYFLHFQFGQPTAAAYVQFVCGKCGVTFMRMDMNQLKAEIREHKNTSRCDVHALRVDG